MKFVKSVLLIIGTKYVSTIIKILTSVMVARLLGPTGKGQLALAFSVVGLLSTLGNLSVGQAFVYNIGRKKIPCGDIMGSALVFALGLSLPLIAGYYFFLPHLTRSFLKGVPVLYLQIGIWMLPISMFYGYSWNIVRGFQDFKLYNLYIMLNKVLKLLFLAISMFLISASVGAAVWANLLSSLVLAIFGVHTVYRFSGRQLRTSVRSLRSLLGFGMASHIARIFGQLEHRIDIYIINLFLNPATVGLYSVAVGMAEFLWFLSNAVVTVLLPRVSSIEADKAARDSITVCRNTFWLSALAAGLLASAGWILLPLLYGREFAPSYVPFVILLPGVLVSVLSRIGGSYLQGTGKPLLFSAITVFSLTLNILLNVILIPRLDLVGAALSSTISYSVNGLVTLFFFLRHTGAPLASVLLVNREDVVRYKRILGAARAWVRRTAFLS